MNARRITTLIVLLGLALVLIAGCGKKRAESMPPGATKVEVKEEPTDWGKQETGISEAELRAQQKAQAVGELATMIHFEFDSSELSQMNRDILQTKAGILKNYTDLTLVIEGYCDERGTVEYNLALGERRARAAYDYLVILGVVPERLSIVSFGEENPLRSGSDEAAWAENRRDQFRVFQ